MLKTRKTTFSCPPSQKSRRYYAPAARACVWIRPSIPATSIPPITTSMCLNDRLALTWERALRIAALRALDDIAPAGVKTTHRLLSGIRARRVPVWRVRHQFCGRGGGPIRNADAATRSKRKPEETRSGDCTAIRGPCRTFKSSQQLEAGKRKQSALPSTSSFKALSFPSSSGDRAK